MNLRDWDKPKQDNLHFKMLLTDINNYYGIEKFSQYKCVHT